MSVYIECFNNCGKKYLRIMENTYTRKNGQIKILRKTIKNLGYLENFDDGKPDFLIRFREKFKNGELDIEGLPEINIKKKKAKKEVIDISFHKEDFILEPKNIGYFILNKLYNDLGIYEVLNRYKSDSKIKYDLNGITKLLVFNRILDPSSKKGAFEKNIDYLYPITSSKSLKEVYRTLDILDEKSISIQKRMNTKLEKLEINRDTKLTYYDVTNYYFETMYGDEDVYKTNELGEPILDEKGKPIIIKKRLRKKGVGKEHRPNPLVSMGLLIDNHGLPILYNVFPGNMQDKTTFKKIIKEEINKLNLGKIVVVADNGVYAQENMYLLINKGNGYIISKSVKKHWNTKPTKTEKVTLKEWALDESDYYYTYNNETITFKSKSRIYERLLKDKNGNMMTVKEKQIIFWSKKHYERELKQNQKFIEYLESCKENPNKLKDKQRKSQKFIKVLQIDKQTGEVVKTKQLVVLLEDKIIKYKETMGFYSIVTSEIDTDDREIINRYRGLSRIEDSFRIIKSDLEGRPIYVKKDEHINAHFLICFISLLIIRIIQYKTLKYENKSSLNTEGWTQGITAEKIKKALKEFKADRLPDGYFKVTKIENELELIFKALGIDFNFKDYTAKELIKLRKLINQ